MEGRENMEYLDLDALQTALIAVSARIVESEGRLTELDTIIGDGDHGYGMQSGFSALQELLSSTRYPDALSLMKASGIQLLRVMGGASGVIFGTMFTGGHEAVKGKTRLNADDLISFFDQGAKTIMRRGRSAAGDKTMLDALLAAIEAMRKTRETNTNVEEILRAAAAGAKEGVEATKQMLPKTGRSKNFREQALGYPDPGAVSVSIIFEAFYDSVAEQAAKSL